MVSLELLIDASGMQRGAAQATQALEQVTSKATQTQQSVSRVGQNLNVAFAATSGTTGFATNIVSAAQALDRLNVAAAGFSGARALTDISRVGADLANLGGRFGAIGLAIGRLTPALLIASTALSAISLGMELFASDTDKATESIQRQETALGRLLGRIREVNIRSGYGQSDPRQSISGTVDALTALRLRESDSQLSIRDVAGLFGVSESEARTLLARGGLGESAFEGQQTRIRLPSDRPFDPASGPISGFQFNRNFFTQEQVLSAGETLLGDRRGAEQTTAEAERRAREDAEQRIRQERDLSALQDERERQNEERAKQARELAREVEEAARRTGEYFGDGVADLVLGLRSAKEVASSIAQDFVRLGLREAVGGVFAAARNAFGTTGAQGTPPPSTG